MKHLTKEVRELLGRIMSIDQNNYPETLYHTCIINAPAAFRMIWAAVKPMLNARTQSKVEVRVMHILVSDLARLVGMAVSE